MNNLLRFLRGHEPDVKALSAHLDGQLDAAEAERLQAHLASCTACRARFDALHATRAALRAMPEAEAPRSFRLRAADVAPAPSRSARGPSPMLRWAPAVGAVAVVVLAVVVGVDLSSSRGASNSGTKPMALSAQQADTASSAESSGAADKSVAGAPAFSATPGGASADGVSNSDSAPLAPPAAQPPENATEPRAATATPPARAAARPVATPTSELQAASGEATASDGGNNTTALRVIEVIAAAIAVLSAAAAVTLWRRGKERLS